MFSSTPNCKAFWGVRVFLVAQWVKNWPAIPKTHEVGAPLLGQEDPLEESRRSTLVFLSAEPHGQRGPQGYSAQGHRVYHYWSEHMGRDGQPSFSMSLGRQLKTSAKHGGPLRAQFVADCCFFFLSFYLEGIWREALNQLSLENCKLKL